MAPVELIRNFPKLLTAVNSAPGEGVSSPELEDETTRRRRVAFHKSYQERTAARLSIPTDALLDRSAAARPARPILQGGDSPIQDNRGHYDPNRDDYFQNDLTSAHDDATIFPSEAIEPIIWVPCRTDLELMWSLVVEN